MKKLGFLLTVIFCCSFLTGKFTIAEPKSLIDNVFCCIPIDMATLSECKKTAEYNNWEMEEDIEDGNPALFVSPSNIWVTPEMTYIDEFDAFFTKSGVLTSFCCYSQYDNDSMKGALMSMERIKNALEATHKLQFKENSDNQFGENYRYGYTAPFKGGTVELLVFKNKNGYVFRAGRVL